MAAANPPYRDEFDRVPCGTVPYGIGEWDHLEHGNHRAVVQVRECAPAVCAYLPWRRRDRHPESKHVRVVAAATGEVVANSVVVVCNREYGEVVFEPTSGPGAYYLYYLVPVPDPAAHAWPRWAFPITRYLPPRLTASPAWLAANGLAPEQVLPLPQTEIRFTGEVPPPEGEAGIGKGTGRVYPASWRTLPRAALLEFQARTAFDSFYPMEVVATQDERVGIEYRGRYRPFLLFPESRRHPIRMVDALPQHWAVRSLDELDSFADCACRNEYFVFQLGVYAHRGTVADLTVQWSDLEGPGGARIAAAALTCFNTEGIDQHGRYFRKRVHVETRRVQALWFGVDIPDEALPGRYTGTVTVGAAGVPGQAVRLILDIDAERLADRGDGDHWRLSRLRWLNSRLGLDDEVCPPYTAVVVDGLKTEVLGRRIELGENGLPARLTSYIDMFEIAARGRPILAAPTELAVTCAPGDPPVQPRGCRLLSAVPGRATFASAWEDARLEVRHETVVEMEGVVASTLRLRAREAVRVQSVRLDLHLDAAVAQLILWPTAREDGDVCPDAYEVEAFRLEHFWVGDYNAGLGLRVPPGDNGWDNEQRGTLRLSKDGRTCQLTLESGPLALGAGEEGRCVVEFYVTPFRPLPRAHWDWRYYHARYQTLLDIPQGVAAGAKVFIQHHETEANPYISYPLLTSATLKRMADQVHAAGGLFKFYYTVRELSVRCPELWALRSLGDEILVPAVGRFGYEELADLPVEYQMRDPYDHPFTGMPWLCEHLASDYHSRWHSADKSPALADGSLQISGASRWGNFFIESLRWLMEHAGLDGLYFDGLTFDRAALRRVRKTLMRAKPYGLIDNHGGPQHLDRAPFYDSLWFGEGADYRRGPAYWLTMVSGIPFGLPGELLLPDASVARGMVYGVSQRYGWMPLDQVDPSGLWRWWDEFGIAGARMLGYWDPACPVRVSHPQVKATAYVRHGQRVAIALASWAATEVTVALALDWEVVGLSPRTARARIPAIEFFQAGAATVSLEAVTVAPDKGWLIVIE